VKKLGCIKVFRYYNNVKRDIVFLWRS